MAKHRTKIEAAAGKLISSIQKEWGQELGESTAKESEEIIHKSHNLLKAGKEGNIKDFLCGLTIAEYLDSAWVERHPAVEPAILTLEIELNNQK